MDFLTLKRHNSFQNENNRKATHVAPRPLIFKLQQEVLKFNICAYWSSLTGNKFFKAGKLKS